MAKVTAFRVTATFTHGQAMTRPPTYGHAKHALNHGVLIESQPDVVRVDVEAVQIGVPWYVRRTDTGAYGYAWEVTDRPDGMVLVHWVKGTPSVINPKYLTRAF